MAVSEWERRGPYGVRRVGSWQVELLLGDEQFEDISTPCDVTMTRSDGARYYGTIADGGCLSAVMENLKGQGEVYMSLRAWLLVPDLSQSAIDSALSEIVRDGFVEAYFERLDDTSPDAGRD